MRRHAPRLALALLYSMTLWRCAIARADVVVPRVPHAMQAAAVTPSVLAPVPQAVPGKARMKPPLELRQHAPAEHEAHVAAPTTAVHPDLVPWDAGFAQLVVPYDLSDIPGAGPLPPVAAPRFLTGDVPTTRMAYAIANNGYTAAPPFSVARRLDGVTFATDSHPAVDSAAVSTLTNLGSPAIRGGRHTLGVAADPDDLIVEQLESNNAWARQWVWSPTQLTPGVSVDRTGVPAPTGGGDAVPGGLAYPNCDGLRSPNFAGDPAGFGGYWNAVAICPRNANDDVDLGLYAPSTGPEDGFKAPLATSTAGQGVTDFVLVDADPAGGGAGSEGPRDIGTTLFAGVPNLTYSVSTVPSAWVGSAQGLIANRTIGSGRLLALWELNLPAGDHTINLDNVSGGADLDMAVVPRNPASGGYYNLAGASTYGQVSNGGLAGDGERIVMVGKPAGYYALLVWKYSSAELNKAANFLIRIAEPTSGVDAAGTPPASRFEDASPNPVRAAASLAFTLARDARVELAIHDVTGRRVATVASGAYPAGSHTVVWSGRGDDGHALPGGLYFARFAGDGVRQTRKLTLVY